MLADRDNHAGKNGIRGDTPCSISLEAVARADQK
jgi:hypothetical protein